MRAGRDNPTRIPGTRPAQQFMEVGMTLYEAGMLFLIFSELVLAAHIEMMRFAAEEQQ